MLTDQTYDTDTDLYHAMSLSSEPVVAVMGRLMKELAPVIEHQAEKEYDRGSRLPDFSMALTLIMAVYEASFINVGVSAENQDEALDSAVRAVDTTMRGMLPALQEEGSVAYAVGLLAASLEHEAANE